MLRHSLLDWTGWLATCETHLILQTILHWCDMFPFMLSSCHSLRSSGRGEKNCERRSPRCPAMSRTHCHVIPYQIKARSKLENNKPIHVGSCWEGLRSHLSISLWSMRFCLWNPWASSIGFLSAKLVLLAFYKLVKPDFIMFKTCWGTVC